MQTCGKYIIKKTEPKHAEQLEILQSVVFPTLAKEELISKEQYLNHIKVFPEGQLVVLDGDIVICGSTTMRANFSEKQHTFLEATDNLWINNHNPIGEWMYGIDVSVHPSFQRQGIGGAVYRYRQETARKLNCKGQITVGMTNGFINYSKEMTIEEYCKLLIDDKIKDPTVSAQRKCGFRIIKPLYNYLEDPKCGNAGMLMYWPLDEKLILL